VHRVARDADLRFDDEAEAGCPWSHRPARNATARIDARGDDLLCVAGGLGPGLPERPIGRRGARRSSTAAATVGEDDGRSVFESPPYAAGAMQATGTVRRRMNRVAMRSRYVSESVAQLEARAAA
jgi:hypothetical protein